MFWKYKKYYQQLWKILEKFAQQENELALIDVGVVYQKGLLGIQEDLQKFKIGAKDKSNNVGVKLLTIDVIDDIAPVWYVDKSLIFVDASVTLTQQDIINLMIQSGEITNDYSIVQMSAADYFESPNKAGSYNVKVLVKYASGKQFESEKTIEVIDDSGNIKVEKKNLWDKICDFFIMIYEKVFAPIGRFFKNIWNKIFH